MSLIARHKHLRKAIIEVFLVKLGEKGLQVIKSIIATEIKIPEFLLVEKSGAFDDEANIAMVREIRIL